jgi:replication-associated recombination protein RarA
MNSQHKYRPLTINEFVFANDDVERKIKRYTAGKTSRPLVLHGTYGTGKSLLAEIIPKSLDGQYVKVDHIKAEDLNSNAEVRKAFSRSKQFDKLFTPEGQSRNYIVVDEVNLDPRAKGALRSSLDEMEGRDLVIFTTNEIEKIDPGLRSRAEVIEVPPVPPQRFLPRAQGILRSEGVDLDDAIILQTLEAVYGSDFDNRAYYKVIDEIIDAVQNP